MIGKTISHYKILEKLGEGGDGLWMAPNTGATNESGFTALPAGYCDSAGNFPLLGITAYFWSTTEAYVTTAWHRSLYRQYSSINRGSDTKSTGMSIRCVRD